MAAALLLVWYSAPVGDMKVDLRYVPVALVTLRYGIGPGALVALGMFAYYSGIVFILGAEFTEALRSRRRRV